MSGLAFASLKGLVWLQSTVFIVLCNRRISSLHPDAVTACSIGPPGYLLAYRLCMLAWAVGIGVAQLVDKGRVAFIYATVWNWWLLVAYLALASAASLRAMRRRQQQQQREHHSSLVVDWLDKSIIALLNVELPSTLIICSLTWTVLVPMLLASPDTAKVTYWRARLFCFESYNQHGFNIAMMLGELALSRVPVIFFASGWLGIWSSTFGLWSELFFARTGRHIYPFLDVQKENAWQLYLGITIRHYLSHLIAIGLYRLKERVVPPPTHLRPASTMRRKAKAH